MATSLAAAIKNEFGLIAELNEGHNGIYEVAINGNIVYTNQEQAVQFPTDEEIFQEIRQYKAPLPEKGQEEYPTETTDSAPYCSWPPASANLQEM